MNKIDGMGLLVSCTSGLHRQRDAVSQNGLIIIIQSYPVSKCAFLFTVLTRVCGGFLSVPKECCRCGCIVPLMPLVPRLLRDWRRLFFWFLKRIPRAPYVDHVRVVRINFERRKSHDGPVLRGQNGEEVPTETARVTSPGDHPMIPIQAIAGDKGKETWRRNIILSDRGCLTPRNRSFAYQRLCGRIWTDIISPIQLLVATWRRILHVPFQQIVSKKEQRGPERDHVTKPPSLQSEGRPPLRSCYHGGPDARTLDRCSRL